MRGYIITGLLLLSAAAFAQIRFGQRYKTKSSDPTVNYSSPKEYEISDITVEGVQFLDNNALISLSGLKVGDKIKVPGDEISDAIKKLWKQGIIGNISIVADKIEGDKIWLKIILAERPRLNKYDFTGLNKSHQSEIKGKIELVRGKVLTDMIIKNTELAVKKHFESKGYLNVEVNIRRVKDTILSNSVNIIIDVEKNQKVKIERINFYGNDNFSMSKLRSKLKNTGEKPRIGLPEDLLLKTLDILKPKNFFHFLTNKRESDWLELKEYFGDQVSVNIFKAAKYVKGDFEEDKQSLIAFYNSKGYRDAEIVTDSIYNIDRKYMNLDLYLNPGRKYYFGDITWSGNYLYGDEVLDKVLGIKKGDVYDLDLLNKKLNYNPAGADISALYMDDGYLFFRVVPVEVAVHEDSIHIEMRINEGSQATIDKIIISGNNKTNDHVILRELRTLPGQKFNRSELIRSQRELSQLGYFDPEQLNPVPVPNPAKLWT